MTEVLASASDVGRRYGATVALHGVDLDVPAGALLGLLGPNGAGKSTLINLITGLRRPTSGSVRLFGGSPRHPANRRQLGMTPQQTGLPETLRVREVVDFVGRHFPDPVPTGELLERFALDGLGNRQTGGLSGGQQRRLSVALAFVGNPRLVVLDEPTTGLDVAARRGLWDGIREYHARRGTVLLTSHYLEEIEALAERVAVIAHGRLVTSGSLDEVRATVTRNVLSVRAEWLPDLPGVDELHRDGEHVLLHTADSDAVVRAMVQAGVPFRDLQVRRASLEEAFLAITETPEAVEPE